MAPYTLTKQEAIEAMDKLIASDKTEEYTHEEADEILCKLLLYFGQVEVVERYRSLDERYD